LTYLITDSYCTNKYHQTTHSFVYSLT